MVLKKLKPYIKDIKESFQRILKIKEFKKNLKFKEIFKNLEEMNINVYVIFYYSYVEQENLMNVFNVN